MSDNGRELVIDAVTMNYLEGTPTYTVRCSCGQHFTALPRVTLMCNWCGNEAEVGGPVKRILPKCYG